MKYDFNTPIARENTGSVKWQRYSGKNVIPMWVADMDLPVADPIKEALLRRASHRIFGYTGPSQELVDSVCHMLETKYQWIIDPSWIVWLPGTLPGIAAGCRAFSGRGEQIVFNIPAFSEFYKVVQKSGREPLEIRMRRDGTRRWTFDWQALRESITSRTRVMLLCSPNNPTGTLFTPAELIKLARICVENNIVLLSDEVHSGLILAPGKIHTPTACACPDAADMMVTLMSPSKTYNLGGVNCSFAIIQNAELRRQYVSECEAFGMIPMASTFSYAAALAAYRDSHEWHIEVIKYLWDNYQYLESRLQYMCGIDVSPLEATYLAWLDVSALNLLDANSYFESYGVGMSSGDAFGAPGYLRMNFACSRDTLSKALDRIELAVANTHRYKRSAF